MSAKHPPRAPGSGSSNASRRRASKDDDEEEEEEEEETNDFVPDDDDDDDDDDSEFDDNAASSSSIDDEDVGARNDAILDGILALDESKRLHFQGDAFHLVSTEPVEWGVLNFAQWKSTSQGVKQHTVTMRGDFHVEFPWQEAESPKGTALKSPPPSLLKSPPSASQDHGVLKSPSPTEDSSSMEPTNGSHKAFLFEISVTDYTGTKSDPSIRRIDHEHTHVPTHPDCLYHLEATATSLDDATAKDRGNHPNAALAVRFRGDYYPQDSDDPCRTVCKFVKPRKRVGGGVDHYGSDDGKKPPADVQLSVENGPSRTQDDEKHLSSSTAAVATSPYAAAAARGSLGDDDFEDNDDDEDDEDVDGDYDEDVDGDELLALQQEAAMSTADVLRKRYRGNPTDGAKSTDDGGSLSATKRGRRRDDDDDSDYGF